MPNVQEQDQEIQDSDFQLDRSRRLLRVRSSDLYQNEAVFLYFHLVLLVFKLKNSTFVKFENSVRLVLKNHTFSVGHEPFHGENVEK